MPMHAYAMLCLLWVLHMYLSDVAGPSGAAGDSFDGAGPSGAAGDSPDEESHDDTVEGPTSEFTVT